MPGASGSGRASVRVLLAAVVVGVVLADSSIVMLALPDILREFGASVGDVAWVLISFNVVLAVAAVPAVWLVRRVGGVAAWRGGLVVFAAASLACVVAPGLWVLVGARCVQALGGAVVVAVAFDELIANLGRERAATAWIGAGIVGAAIGPAVGGALTELLSWQAIFAVQVPLVALATVARGFPRDREPAPGRPPGLILASLALVSAALTAALFLLVVMLIEGWRLPPIEAAGVVTIMPAAALATRRVARHMGGVGASAGAGAIALAGGLAALGLLPGADVTWVVAPELLIGFGLGVSLGALAGRLLSLDLAVGGGGRALQ
jgi:MFS family permease